MRYGLANVGYKTCGVSIKLSLLDRIEKFKSVYPGYTNKFIVNEAIELWLNEKAKEYLATQNSQNLTESDSCAGQV